MISNQKIKNLLKKEGKKISKNAIKKLTKILEEKIVEVAKKASRNADFAGRIIIKEEDISEYSE